jgi:hypothetical protein
LVALALTMKNSKNITLALFLFSAILNGVARQVTAPGEPFAQVDILFIFSSTVLIFTWFRIDANERGYKRSPVLNVAVVALAALSLPYYFFRSPGFAGGLAATATFVGIVVLFSAVQYAGSYAVYLIQS